MTQAAEKEAVIKEQKKLQRTATKKKGEKTGDKGNHSAPQSGKTVSSSGKWSAAVTGARTVEDRSRKRKVGAFPVTMLLCERLGHCVHCVKVCVQKVKLLTWSLRRGVV